MTVYFYIPIGIFLTLAVFKGPYKSKAEAFCRSRFPQVKPVAAKPSLNRHESQRVTQAVEKALSERNDTEVFGVPPIDVLEGATKEDLEEELREVSEAWQSFRGRRGSFSEDMDGLRDAYNNFTSEINDIFQAKKVEVQTKAKPE
ncbi:hypothetical protein OXX79_011507 [Metschnikowia pulcherrima]